MASAVETKLDTMSLREKVGQLLHIGIGDGYFEDDVGWPTAEMRTALHEFNPGAVRVYGLHNHDPYFMAHYVNTLQKWAKEAGVGLPLLVSTDSEYGAKDILSDGVCGYPSMMGRTATGSSDFAESVSATLARDLRSFGFNMIHQPDVDVNTNPNNPVIGVRAAGYDTEDVVTFSKDHLRGAHNEGVVTVAKHYPGHGDTKQDSHHSLPTVTYGRDTLEDVHLKPFAEAIEAGVDAIMTSHIIVECLDDENPATLSPAIINDLLRDEMGYDGIVITDALSMNAIAENYSFSGAAVQAIEAGADLLLTGFCSFETLVDIRDALIDAVEVGRITRERIDESVRRVLAVKERHELSDKRFVSPVDSLSVTGSNAHQNVATEAYEESFTLLGSDTIFPLTTDDSVLVTGVKEVRTIEPFLDDAFGDLVSYQLPMTFERPEDSANWASDPDRETTNLQQAIDTATALADTVDLAVVLTYTDTRFPDHQQQFTSALARDLPVIVVSLGLPVEYKSLDDDIAYVATYAQDRLGMPDPLPEAACLALQRFMKTEQNALNLLPIEETNR